LPAQVPHFNAYIDEAGDEGFSRPHETGPGTSSEWLVLAGVIVPEERDLALSGTVDELRVLLGKPGPKPLHFRLMRTHERKRAAMALLATKPFVFSVVALWKPAIYSGYLQQPPHLYNYAARFLIERLTWYASERHRKLNLYFENRTATSYAHLTGYMEWIQRDPTCQIAPNTIAEFRPVSPTLKMAQVADFYASATAAAIEPDQNYGLTEEKYLLAVRDQLYRMPGKSLFSFGFKVFPDHGADRARFLWLAGL
jgi:hypothetical protein